MPPRTPGQAQGADATEELVSKCALSAVLHATEEQ